MLYEQLTLKQMILLGCLPNGYIPSTALQFITQNKTYRSKITNQMDEEKLIRIGSYVDDSNKKQTYRTFSITKKGYAELM